MHGDLNDKKEPAGGTCTVKNFPGRGKSVGFKSCKQGQCGWRTESKREVTGKEVTEDSRYQLFTDREAGSHTSDLPIQVAKHLWHPRVCEIEPTQGYK